MKAKTRSLLTLLMMVLALLCISFGAAFTAFADGVTGSGESVDGEVTISSFSLDSRAEIRTVSPLGLRFTASISEDDLKALPNNAVFGMIIIPNEVLGTNEFTLDNSDVLDIPATMWAETGDTYYYTGVLVGKEGVDYGSEYYATDILAKAYVKYQDTSETWHVAYAGEAGVDTVANRSMAYCAGAALLEIDEGNASYNLYKGVVDSVVDNISFASSSTLIAVDETVEDLGLDGASGVPVKYSVEDAAVATVNESGNVVGVAQGQTTVTATVGSRTATTTINVKTPAVVSYSTIRDVPTYEKADIASAVNLPLTLTGDSLDNITKINGTSAYQKTDAANMSVTLSDSSSSGERHLFVYTSNNNIFDVKICVADQIITSGDEFSDMMKERIINSTTIPDGFAQHYYVLGNDITIQSSQFVTDNAGNYGDIGFIFADVFDGRGYSISPTNGQFIWTRGLFTVMRGATVKNLTLVNPLLRSNGRQYAGGIAVQVAEDSTIENCVVINPYMSAAANTNETYGAIAGAVYSNSRIINTLVVDTVQGVPYTQTVNYENGKFMGGTGNYAKSYFNALVGIVGASCDGQNFVNTYALTGHGYNGAFNGSIEGGATYNDLVCDGLSALKTAAGISDLSELSFTAGLQEANITAKAVSAFANSATTDEVQFFGSFFDDNVTGISFADNEIVTAVGGSVALPAISGNGAYPVVYFANSADITVSGGSVTPSVAGTYTVTAYCGLKTATITVHAVEPVALSTLSTAEIILASDISDGKIAVDLKTVDFDDIEEVSGYTVEKNGENGMLVTLPDTTYRGDITFTIFTADSIYILGVCLADYKLSTDREFMSAYVNMFTTAASVDTKYYYALGADVHLSQSKLTYDETSGTITGGDHVALKHNFYHTFDGRGHKISGVNGGPIWTLGVFGNVSGGTVKNVVLYDLMVRVQGNELGTVAVRASNGAVIENVVVVNPTFRGHDVGTTNLAVGMLVGTVYSANTVIRNNIVIDSVTSLPAVITASTYHTNANGKLSYTSLTEDGKWSFFNGLIGGVGGSASIAGGNRNINDNYCISSNYGGEDFYAYMNYAGSKYTVPTTNAIATTNAIVADFAAFKAANSNDLSAFVLLTDNGSTGTVAGYTID